MLMIKQQPRVWVGLFILIRLRSILPLPFVGPVTSDRPVSAQSCRSVTAHATLCLCGLPTPAWPLPDTPRTSTCCTHDDLVECCALQSIGAGLAEATATGRTAGLDAPAHRAALPSRRRRVTVACGRHCARSSSVASCSTCTPSTSARWEPCCWSGLPRRARGTRRTEGHGASRRGQLLTQVRIPRVCVSLCACPCLG